MKNYSFTNHLGNLLAVVSDKIIPVDSNSDDQTDYYLAEIISGKDYAPFGGYLPGRDFSSESYPNSFNGKRDDSELGDWQDYGMRVYMKNARRFFEPDPLIVYKQQYPELSSYQFASNSVICSIDLDGLEAKLSIAGDGDWYQDEKKSFYKRAIFFKNKHGFTFETVTSGKLLLDVLEEATKREGSISSLFIFGHGAAYALQFNSGEGFYIEGKSKADSRTIDDLVKKIQDKKIVFEDGAVCIIGSCLSGYPPSEGDDKGAIAYELTKKTGVTTIAPVGLTGSKYDDKGELILTVTSFMEGVTPTFKKYEKFNYNVKGTINDQIVNENFKTKKEANEFIKANKTNTSSLKLIHKTQIIITDLGAEVKASDYIKK